MNNTSIFINAIPMLAASDMNKSVTFYEQRLGFTKLFQFNDYVGLKRDSTEIHLWLCNDKYVAENTACRIKVKHIQALYEEYKASNAIHPNGSLTTKPWGMEEFTILDLDGNAITFCELLEQ